MLQKVQRKTPSPTIEMTVSEWFTVPDNPRQRNTEVHLKRAKHLMTPNPTHAHVAMALAPNGERWKLDGHTRALAWAKRLVVPPTVLHVAVFSVRDEVAAAELYSCFDNKAAVETASDQVWGAFREVGFIPKSKLLQRAALGNALRLAETLYTNRQHNISPPRELSPIHPFVTKWLAQIELLDLLMPTRNHFPGPVVTAALMTLRKHGDKALDFWKKYLNDEGQKTEKTWDAVEALSRYMREAKVVHDPFEMVGKALNAYEGYQKGTMYGKEIQAIDPARYSAR